LGNQFLGHVRTVDAIAHVVRLFEDSDVVHVSGKVDPVSDLERINTELMLSDLEMLEKRRDKAYKNARSNDPDAKAEYELIISMIADLSEGRAPRYDKDDPKMKALAENFGLLTVKPAFVCANVGEDQAADYTNCEAGKRLAAYAAEHGLEVVPVCAKFEDELSALSPEEAEIFMADLGISGSGLDRVVETGYRLLDYITFFTAGPMESRAWTVTRGSLAPEAAGKIHTDMQRGFIRMETVSYEDLVACGSWAKAQLAGKLRIEGKDYVMQDGDVIHVRFSV
jgi:GTP-binding protein YchF